MPNLRLKDKYDTIICPGCGWEGCIEEIKTTPYANCPKCTYENGGWPFRLMTIRELMEEDDDGDFNSVNLSLFLRKIIKLLNGGDAKWPFANV